MYLYIPSFAVLSCRRPRGSAARVAPYHAVAPQGGDVCILILYIYMII